MSRNLCNGTGCAFCSGEVKKTGPDRPITVADCFAHYYPEYQGMIVADAACVDCEAPYLAWLCGDARKTQYVHGIGFNYPEPIRDADGTFQIRDLSHKHAFNDEPAPEDFPKWKMVRSREPWPRCTVCGGPMAAYGNRCDQDYKHPKAGQSEGDGLTRLDRDPAK